MSPPLASLSCVGDSPYQLVFKFVVDNRSTQTNGSDWRRSVLISVRPVAMGEVSRSKLEGLFKKLGGGFYIVVENFLQPNLAISLKILKNWGA